MKERAFIISVVVVVAVFVGVTVAIQSNNAPALRQLAEQQSRMVTLLRKLEVQIVQGSGGAAPSAGSLSEVKALNQKLGELLTLYKKFDQAQPPAQAQKPSRPKEDLTTVHEIPVGDSVIRGKKDAPITIVSFVDFQCPFSARFQPVIDSVYEAYPDKVKLVLKHFPLGFHKMAKPAGRAVLAAGEQGKYWEMVDLILANNRGLNDEKFEGFAKTLKLNMGKFKKSYADKGGEWDKLMQEDYQLGVKVGVRGTPTYYLNGRKTRARTLEMFKNEIDAILNKKSE